jgi:hypothetical protein
MHILLLLLRAQHCRYVSHPVPTLIVVISASPSCRYSVLYLFSTSYTIWFLQNTKCLLIMIHTKVLYFQMGSFAVSFVDLFA